MTRLQSVIVMLTLTVCLGVGLWASQRTPSGESLGSVGSVPVVAAAVDDDTAEFDSAPIIPAVATEPAVSPRKLTAEDAAPVTDHPVRRAIDRLMPNASAEEREIWFEELRELPISAVEDLLKLRKESNVAAPLRGSPEPLPTAGEVSAPSALLQHRAVLRHNLLNAETPGYRALRVDWLARPLEPAMSSDDIATETRHLAALRIETRVGPMKVTERPLDLAIQGSGWFVVEDENGQPAFTRYGAVSLNEQHELQLPAIPNGRPLSPRITIPEDMAAIFIDAKGQIYGAVELGRWDDEHPIGQIRLARFFDDSALVLHKDGLYHPTPAAGTMTRCVPGEQAGVIESGALERSNVDREAQEAALQRVETWIKRQSPHTP